MKDHPHSSVNDLVQHLQSVYTIKKNNDSAFDAKASNKYGTSYNQSKVKSHSENSRLLTTSNNYEATTSKNSLFGIKTEQQQQELKQQMSKLYRHPWRANGMFHDKDTEVKRLPAKDLDNWQIYRINMSKRSYQCPKNYKGMKVPAIGRQFMKYDCKDKDGHYPYLYQSDMQKIERIRDKIYSKPFKRTNTVRHQLFGVPQQTFGQKKVNQRPMSLVNFEQKKSKKIIPPL